MVYVVIALSGVHYAGSNRSILPLPSSITSTRKNIKLSFPITYLPNNLPTSYVPTKKPIYLLSNNLPIYLQTTYLLCTYKQPTFFVPTNNLPTLYLQTTYLLSTYKQPTYFVPPYQTTTYLPTEWCSFNIDRSIHTTKWQQRDSR